MCGLYVRLAARMVAVNSINLVDREPLTQIIIKELKKKGLCPNLDTPKPCKKYLAPFSTPGGTSSQPTRGRVFGKRLTDLSKLLVSLDEYTDVLVPKFVVNACTYIENNVTTEGLYRLAGSNARQKNIRRELEMSETELDDIGPLSVIDVASLLKQFLRELPLPLIPINLHSLLAESLAKGVASLQVCLLLLPSEYLSCLAYLCRHLACVAQHAGKNKMTVRNLAIVLTPSLFPIQENYVSNSGKDRKFADGDKKLKVHTAVVEALINNASQIGYLSSDVYDQYAALTSSSGHTRTSTSEDNLDLQEPLIGGPSKRKSKKRSRRRSGSLSRVLSVMGKGIRAMARSTTPSKASESSFHSTPLPTFGATPDFPSPRIAAANSKRKASAEHELSPTSKHVKRGNAAFDPTTFTPKMRTRTFSVKRFKRKKSDGKMAKETFRLHADMLATSAILPPPTSKADTTATATPPPQNSPHASNCSTDATPINHKTDSMEWENDDTFTSKVQDSQFENDYAEVKAQYNDLKKETQKLEEDLCYDGDDSPTPTSDLSHVQQRYMETLASGGALSQETRETARKIARVKRRSSEGRKPRSPSERRIGVIRRSRERDEQRSKQQRGSPIETNSGTNRHSPRERGRSPGVRHNNVNRSPSTRVALTPVILDASEIRGRLHLQRGRPNKATSGLQRPSPTEVVSSSANGCNVVRVKHSFKGKDKSKAIAALKSIGPILAEMDTPGNGSQQTSRRRTSSRLSSGSVSAGSTRDNADTTDDNVAINQSHNRQLKSGDSIASLRQDIQQIIDRSLGSSDEQQAAANRSISASGTSITEAFDGSQSSHGSRKSSRSTDQQICSSKAIICSTSSDDNDLDNVFHTSDTVDSPSVVLTSQRCGSGNRKSVVNSPAAAVAAEEDNEYEVVEDVFQLSSKMAHVSFNQDGTSISSKNGSISRSTEEDNELTAAVESHRQLMDARMFSQDSPVTRSQLRRQSHSFEFIKPQQLRGSGSGLAGISCDTLIGLRGVPASNRVVSTSTSNGGSITSDSSGFSRTQIRRQSSAFEFQTHNARTSGAPKVTAAVPRVVEPVQYENLTRDSSLRASLRRRNSSVKDLINRMENETRRRVGAPVGFPPEVPTPGVSTASSTTKINGAASLGAAPVTLVYYPSRRVGKVTQPSTGLTVTGDTNNGSNTSSASGVTASTALCRGARTDDFGPGRVDNSRRTTRTSTAQQQKQQQSLQVTPTTTSRLNSQNEPFCTPPPPQSSNATSAVDDDEMWVDGSEFFKSVRQADSVPECGRSSIVKIRQEQRGRVLSSVNKFSSSVTTPRRHATAAVTPIGGTRRMSARMGVCASPSLGPAPPPATRRQTLTGIKTSAVGGRGSSVIASSTTSTTVRKFDKTPVLAAPSASNHISKPKKSPAISSNRLTTTNTTSVELKKRKSPNTAAGRTVSRRPSHRDAKMTKGSSQQSSSSNAKTNNGKTANVRRTASSTVGGRKAKDDAAGGRNRRKEKRFLTIGYLDEIRSPLKECKNIHANIKRSNSDQTPCSKRDVSSRTHSTTTPHQYQNIPVARSASLKSDVLMSPQVVKLSGRSVPATLAISTPAGSTRAVDRVRRAKSERSAVTPVRTITPRANPRPASTAQHV